MPMTPSYNPPPMSRSVDPDHLAIFRAYYHRERQRDCSESLCGSGSTLKATATLRAMLPRVLRGLEVSVMLDAPCGDLHWLKPADLPLSRYIGVDILSELVEEARNNSEGFGDFYTADITTDPLPAADLIFCRDCLVHLSNDLVLAALDNMRASGARFLMTTTFYALQENVPCASGGWRPINLQLPPFSLPTPLVIIPEGHRTPPDRHFDKSMAVWDLSD
jgi:SAM-dependent methyltransferase